jgi:hypothetical protein
MLEGNSGHSCDVSCLTALSVDIIMGLASVVDDWMSIDQWWHYSDRENEVDKFHPFIGHEGP